VRLHHHADVIILLDHADELQIVSFQLRQEGLVEEEEPFRLSFSIVVVWRRYKESTVHIAVPGVSVQVSLHGCSF
jgi:hypothetical protein